MDFVEIKKFIMSLDTLLSEKMKNNIHYRSMRNFVYHFDEIPDNLAKEKIRKLFSEYIEEIREKDYFFEGKESTKLARKYLFVISSFYREYSNFAVIRKLEIVLCYGILVDSLLFLTKISSRIKYIPIATIFLLIYYFIIKIFKAPKGRVYGIFY